MKPGQTAKTRFKPGPKHGGADSPDVDRRCLSALRHVTSRDILVSVNEVASALMTNRDRVLKDWAARQLPRTQVGRAVLLPSANVIAAYGGDDDESIRRRASVRANAYTARAGVYVVLCDRFVKIGRATHLERRLAGLQYANPHPIELQLFLPTETIADAIHLERDLHERFTHQRHGGEWFHDCAEIRAFIAQKKGQP